MCLPACLPACLRRSHARGWSPAHGEHAAARSKGERVLSQETRPTSKLRLAERQGGSAQIGGEPGFLVRKTEGASGGGKALVSTGEQSQALGEALPVLHVLAWVMRLKYLTLRCS